MPNRKLKDRSGRMEDGKILRDLLSFMAAAAAISIVLMAITLLASWAQSIQTVPKQIFKFLSFLKP